MILKKKINHYLDILFPINRSITGDGVRNTLKILQEIVPLTIKEYPSGQKVFDWIIPDEWNVKDAWIKNENGKKIVDYKVSNIHLVNYSTPVDAKISFKELKHHLYCHNKIPDAIPYRTTYYNRDWGFCVTKSQYKELENSSGSLEVFIDSNFNENGSLTFGEILIPGKSKNEILISTYICHPSLANDNLSGLLMTAFLANELLMKSELKRSYRIIWIPETIGAIAYCAFNKKNMKKIDSGLVITCVGGPGKFGYKKSFDRNHSVNAVIETVFQEEGIQFKSYPFDIHGSDERQYSSQGFRINVASLTKDKYYEYPFYHSSLDNLDYIKAEYIDQSLRLHLKVLYKLDTEPIYKNRYPNCEINLSKHKLYPTIGGNQLPEKQKNKLDYILWLLWKCDGKKGIYGLSKQLGVSHFEILEIAKLLERKKIIIKVF
tara:strand:+ start:17317 stop:18615 length:1299 start_codon:yes stop_codon:yes gene_type:complete